MKAFDTIIVGEQVPLAFDFSPDLPSGVTVIAADSVEVVVIRGTDATPATIKVGAPAISGSDLLQMVNPLITGVEYRLTAWAIWSDGQKRAITGKLQVVTAI